MRTIVDPSSTAISRSPVIPIERSTRPRSSAIRRSSANASRVARGSPFVGPTVIAPHAALQAAGVDPGAEWARISLTVHSDLAAVGLTAAFARALADKGISANVVAGFYHDHIFVPWLRRHDALNALQELSHV